MQHKMFELLLMQGDGPTCVASLAQSIPHSSLVLFSSVGLKAVLALGPSCTSYKISLFVLPLDADQIPSASQQAGKCYVMLSLFVHVGHGIMGEFYVLE